MLRINTSIGLHLSDLLSALLRPEIDCCELLRVVIASTMRPANPGRDEPFLGCSARSKGDHPNDQRTSGVAGWSG